MATGMWYGRPLSAYPRRLPLRTNPAPNGFIVAANFAWTLENLIGVTYLNMDLNINPNEPITIRNCPDLVTLNTGIIETSSSDIIVQTNPVLTTINFTVLLGFVNLNCSNNPSLTTLSWYDFSPPVVGGFSTFGDLNFSGCALTVSSVNALLALLIIINIQDWGDTVGNWAGVVDLSGGTNAAPTGQGLTDKATLIGRGATVTTN